MNGTDNGDGQSNCGETIAAMYLFLDKEQLTPGERAHVQAHLDECIPCLESFEFEAEFKNLVANKCKEEMPTHLFEMVRTRLQVELDAKSNLPASDGSGNPSQGGIPRT